MGDIGTTCLVVVKGFQNWREILEYGIISCNFNFYFNRCYFELLVDTGSNTTGSFIIWMYCVWNTILPVAHNEGQQKK